jgi:uncharacterized Fe-S cluster protein YjdI
MKVSWDDKKCCHNGNCVKSLPEVFKVENGQFVIQPENSTEEKVSLVVSQCPSKALTIE